ncbi:hypothetical protein MPSEU_000281400 [Mayamaea pseudoterrestris]|nr:hypothetical protein MPSEU_000281400 [Mayamaea pseudoterrestris]
MPYFHQVPERIIHKVGGIMDQILHPNFNTSGSKGDLYDRINFTSPFAWYNARAPPLWYTWLVAACFSLAACWQYSRRVHEYRSHIVGSHLSWSIRIRTLISAYIDTDDAWFVINKFTAQSLWFLGGMQIDYGSAFTVMMACFFVESILDSLRVVIAYKETSSLLEYVPTSDYYVKPKNHEIIVLQPRNVYEDLSQRYTVVLMVFLTQTLLIGIVVADAFHTSTYTSLDGTPNVPIGLTLGSYLFYVLGIFFALVFMLGPKTNYGSSEQNTSFWLQMLLTAKITGACASYVAIHTKKLGHYNLVHNDWRLWLRFVMSFIVNGFGFHVLIHALPIQVGSQSSFTNVVLRSVGMMYLVNLDDTTGSKLTLTEGENPAPVAGNSKMEDEAHAIRRIISEATTRLEALSKNKKGQ